MKAALAGGLLGAALFLAIDGPEIVRPTNLGWTMRHDLQTYVLAWTHFRHTPWQWPLGAVPAVGHPVGTSIGNADAIPVAAFALKPLQAVLPDVARELASELERGRGLSLLLTTVGSYLSSLPAVSPRELQGNCEGATHYVASIWAGAFELKSLDERTLTQAGVLAACAAASSTAGRPPPQCAELVKIELVTLAGPRGEGVEGGERRGEGSAGPLGDGSIVTGTGREVYLIEGGRRREIPDIQTFKALGLDPHKMVTVSDDELARIPLGEPLPRR